MKVRSGFVSNSSSSSFAVYGANIGEQELLIVARSLFGDNPEKKGFIEKYEKEIEDNGNEYGEFYAYVDVTELVSRFLGNGWECQAYTYEEPDRFYIGRKPSSIGDDETGKQFKESVKAVFEKHGLNKSTSFMEGEVCG